MELSKRKRRYQKNKRKTMRVLTNRERFLIVLLIIIMISWISFEYIINPQMIKISDLEQQIDDYTIQIKSNNKIIREEDLIMEEKDKLVVERENSGTDFFKSLSQPEIIYRLNNLLFKNNIEIENIIFNKPIAEILNGREIQKMEISIPFKGGFEALVEIIKEIEKSDRKLVISGIDIEKGEDIELEGSINLGVYSLAEIIDMEEKDINIKGIEDNKSNPFIPYEGYIDPREEIEEDINEDENEDLEDDVSRDKEEYHTYKAIKGDNISYISMQKYGTEKYVDEILEINNMIRSSILPIGKQLKLMKK